MSDLFGNDTPTERPRVAPEPEIYRRAEDAEKDLDRVSRDLAAAEEAVKKAAIHRDQLLMQVQELEAKADMIAGDITADALAPFTAPGAPRSNKEQRDAAVSQALRQDERYARQAEEIARRKTDLHNARTAFDLAADHIKSLHRRVDAAVQRARLISTQIQTLGYLHQYDTVKLQIGDARK